MQSYKMGLISCLIIVLIATTYIVHECINIGKLDQKTTSTEVEVKQKYNNHGDGVVYKYTLTYTFSYQEETYTCVKYDNSTFKRDYSDKEIIYFSSKDPKNCSVGNRSNYIRYALIFDILFVIAAAIFIRQIKMERKGESKC